MSTNFNGFRKKFEEDLRAKLLQKSSTKTSEEAHLVKMFKFFDVHDRGHITFPQFMQVLAKIGF
jgi:Ca2+-binding EF-hand superfamily protein